VKRFRFYLSCDPDGMFRDVSAVDAYTAKCEMSKVMFDIDSNATFLRWEEIDVAPQHTTENQDASLFISYSKTTTQGEKSITKSASITFPRFFDSQSALLMLKAIVDEKASILNPISGK